MNSPNEAYLVAARYRFLRYLLLFVSGVIYAFAFPNANVSWLGWIALVPLYLMTSASSSTISGALFSGLVWGYGWAIVSFFWLGRIEPFIPWVMALVLACFPAAWAAAVPLMRRWFFLPVDTQLAGYDASLSYLRKNKFRFKCMLTVLALASWWCFLEWLRSWIFTGLPWNYMAITQWQNITFLQAASITGIYGLSFVLVLFNISLAELIINIFNKVKHGSGIYVIETLALSIFLAAVFYVYGVYKIEKDSRANPAGVKFSVQVVQGDIPQIRRYSEDEAANALKTYVSLSEKKLQDKPDLLIWPESAVPQPLRAAGSLSRDFRDNIWMLINKYNVPMLIGSIDFGSIPREENGEYVTYNSALLVSQEGRIVKAYNKIHLVPWGEYTPLSGYYPFKWFYPWIIEKFSMGRSLTPGTEHTIFQLKDGIKASVLICYEDAFPFVAREHVLNGANLLITITNDAWFPDSWEPEQHIAQAVLRCIENGRMMIRSGNNNGTCIISPDGRIMDSIFHRTEKGESIPAPDMHGPGTAIFNINVETDPPMTFYTKYGNVFILFCSVISLAAFLFILLQWLHKKQKLIGRIERC